MYVQPTNYPKSRRIQVKVRHVRDSRNLYLQFRVPQGLDPPTAGLAIKNGHTKNQFSARPRGLQRSEAHSIVWGPRLHFFIF